MRMNKKQIENLSFVCRENSRNIFLVTSMMYHDERNRELVANHPVNLHLNLKFIRGQDPLHGIVYSIAIALALDHSYWLTLNENFVIFCIFYSKSSVARTNSIQINCVWTKILSQRNVAVVSTQANRIVVCVCESFVRADVYVVCVRTIERERICTRWTRITCTHIIRRPLNVERESAEKEKGRRTKRRIKKEKNRCISSATVVKWTVDCDVDTTQRIRTSLHIP